MRHRHTHHILDGGTWDMGGIALYCIYTSTQKRKKYRSIYKTVINSDTYITFIYKQRQSVLCCQHTQQKICVILTHVVVKCDITTALATGTTTPSCSVLTKTSTRGKQQRRQRGAVKFRACCGRLSRVLIV